MKFVYYLFLIIIIVLTCLVYSKVNILGKSKKMIETFIDTTTFSLRTDTISPYKNSSIGTHKYNIIDINDNVDFRESVNAKKNISLQPLSNSIHNLNSDVNFVDFDKDENNLYIGQNDINISFPEHKSVKFQNDVKISPQVIFNEDVDFLKETKIDSKVLNMDHKNVFCFKNTNPTNCLTHSDLDHLKDMNVKDIESLYFQTAGACLPSASLIQKNFDDSDIVNFTSLQDDMKCMYPESGKKKLSSWYNNTIA